MQLTSALLFLLVATQLAPHYWWVNAEKPSSYRSANLIHHSSDSVHILALLPRSREVSSASATSTTTARTYAGGFAELCVSGRFVPATSAGRLGRCDSVQVGTVRPVYAISPGSALQLQTWGETWNDAVSNTSEGTLPTFDVMYDLSKRECSELCPVSVDVDTSLSDSPYGRLAPIAFPVTVDAPIIINGGTWPVLEYDADPTQIFLPWFPGGCKRDLVYAPPVGDGSFVDLALQITGHRTVLGEAVTSCLSPNIPENVTNPNPSSNANTTINSTTPPTTTTTATCVSPHLWANNRLLQTRYFCPTMPAFAGPLHAEINDTATNYRPFILPFIDPQEVTATASRVYTISPFNLQEYLPNGTSALLAGLLGVSPHSSGCQIDQSIALFDYYNGFVMMAATRDGLSAGLQRICGSTVTRCCVPSGMYGDLGLQFGRGPLARQVFPQFKINEKMIHGVYYRLPPQNILSSAPVIWAAIPHIQQMELFLPGLELPYFIASISLCEGVRTISEIVNLPNGYLESQDAEVVFGGSSVPFGLGLDERLVRSLTGWTNLSCSDLPIDSSIDAGIALAVHMGYASVENQLRSLKAASLSAPSIDPTTSTQYKSLVRLLAFSNTTPVACFLPITDNSPMPTLYVSPLVPGGTTSDLDDILFGEGMSASSRTSYHASFKTYRMLALQLGLLQVPSLPTPSPSSTQSSSPLTRKGIIIHSLHAQAGIGIKRPRIVLGTHIMQNHWVIVDASESRVGFVEKPTQLQVPGSTLSTSTSGLGPATDAFGGCVAPMVCKASDIFVTFLNKCLDPTCSVVFLEYDEDGLQCLPVWPVFLFFVLLVGTVMIGECSFQCLMTSLYRRMGRAQDNQLLTAM